MTITFGRLAFTVITTAVGYGCYTAYTDIKSIFSLDSYDPIGKIAKWSSDVDFSKLENSIDRDLAPKVQELSRRISNLSLEPFNQFLKTLGEVVVENFATFVVKGAPWLILGTTVVVGPPLGIYYLYKTAIHSIGRPKLAQERNSFSLLDRAYDTAETTFWWSIRSIKTYLKWSVGSMAAVTTGATVASFARGIFEFYYGTQREETWYRDFNSDFFCNTGLISNSQYKCTHSWDGTRSCKPIMSGCQVSINNLLSYDNVVTFSGFLGFAAVTYYTAKGISKYISKNWGVTKSRPIFNESIHECIDDVINSTVNLQKHGGYFQNMILYGPGGTGKTMVSKFIARNSGMNYVMMSGGDLAQYIKRGEHVTELNKLFEDAKSASGPTILFIDEAESLCRDRSQMNRDELFELINAFLNQTGEPSDKIMLILATNRLEDIDEAVLSRMDNKLYIGPPEAAERRKIILMYLTHFFSSYEIKKFFSEDVLMQISEETEGLTGRALFKMLNALSSKKKCSKDNRLTEEMRKIVVTKFVEQEKEVKRRSQEAVAMNSHSNKKSHDIPAA